MRDGPEPTDQEFLKAYLEKHRADMKARGIDDGPVLITAKAGGKTYEFAVPDHAFYPFLRSVRPDLDPWRDLHSQPTA